MQTGSPQEDLTFDGPDPRHKAVELGEVAALSIPRTFAELKFSR
jgi:hypothetical protein